LIDGAEVTGWPAGRLVTLAKVTGTVTGVTDIGAVAGGRVEAGSTAGVAVGIVGGVVAGLMVVVARMMAATVVTARKTGIGRV